MYFLIKKADAGIKSGRCVFQKSDLCKSASIKIINRIILKNEIPIKL